jgi:hypothetical protein
VITFGIAVVAFVLVLAVITAFDVRAERAHTERERHLRALERERHPSSGHVRVVRRQAYDQDREP